MTKNVIIICKLKTAEWKLSSMCIGDEGIAVVISTRKFQVVMVITIKHSSMSFYWDNLYKRRRGNGTKDTWT